MALNGHAAVIEDLIETLEDGYKGFSQAADKLSGDTYRKVVATMRRLAVQREEFAEELRSLAYEHGLEITEEGSVGGSLHRGWMALGDALTGDDPTTVLSAAEAGEDHAVSEYEDALNEELPEDIRVIVTRQATEVKRAHDEVRAFRDSV